MATVDDNLQFHRDWEDGYRDGRLFLNGEITAKDHSRYPSDEGYTDGFDQAVKEKDDGKQR